MYSLVLQPAVRPPHQLDLAESRGASDSTPPPVIGETGEVLSQRNPLVLNTGGDGDIDMAEVNGSAAQKMFLGPSQASEASQLPPTKGEAGGPLSVPNTGDRVVVEWPNMMLEAMNSSSIFAKHRALMGAVLQSVRSINNGLKEVFGGLLIGFEVNKVRFSLKRIFFVNKI